MPRTRNNPERRDHPLSKFTELRVHGVGGTRPEFLLEDDQPELVAGDNIAGFYRIESTPRRGEPQTEEYEQEIEAYSWGGLSSRSGARVLWLMLLPFAFANLAGWMVVKRYTGPRKRLVKAVVRWSALSVTGLFVIWMGAVTVDVIAYQCGGQEPCASNHWWLSFFNYDFFEGNSSRRIAVGLAAPVLVLIGLYLVGRTTLRRYEEAQSEYTADTKVDPAFDVELGDPRFWGSQTLVKKLKRAHVAGGLAGLCFVGSFGLLDLDGSGDVLQPEDPRFWILVLSAVAITLVMAAVALVGRITEAMSWIPLAVAAAATVWLLGDALWREGPEQTVGVQLVGWRHAGLILGAIAMAILVVLAVTTLHVRRPRPVFLGLGPLLVTMLGMLITAAVIAGAIIRVADWLDQGDDQGVVIQVSNAYDWLAVGFFWLLVSIALLALIFYWWHRWKPAPFGKPRRWRAEVDAVLADEPRYRDAITGREAEGRSWLRGMVKARALRRIATHADGIVGPTIVAAFVTAVVLIFTWSLGDPRDDPRPLFGWIAWSKPAASWVLAFFPVALIGTMYRSFRNEGLRRKIGILWETITFWPRWFHPLAPPNYSARAVPELQSRLQVLTRGHRTAVLSTHSQGTVLGAGVILSLDDAARSRVGLLTYGSPLARLYGKFFPTQFGVERMKKVADRLAGNDNEWRWRNLYRLTDAIGGAVGDAEPPLQEPWTVIDRLFDDPRPIKRPAYEPFPLIKGHSGYYIDVDRDAYYAALDEVRA